MLKRLPLLLILLVVVLAAGHFIINNFIAVALIAYGSEDASRAAAVRFAPSNPEISAARGRYLLYRADPPQPTEGVADLQHAVLLSPRDYRFWLELGRGYEAAGEQAQAEQALQRTVALAPQYFDARWALANFRLRAGGATSEQALNDFKTALALSGGDTGRPDRRAALNAYHAVAGVLGVNLAAFRRITPDDQLSRTYLAAALAEHNALDAALAVWRGLPTNDSPAARDLYFRLLADTQAQGRFADEREVWRALLNAVGDRKPDDGNLLTNSGFEQVPLSERFADYGNARAGFDWVMASHTEVAARRDDAQAHTGRFSLRLAFSAPMRSAFQEVWQLVPVEPARSYRLSFYVKTKNLPADTPFVEIVEALRPELFALRLPVPSGTVDWRALSLVFTVPPTARALRLVVRAPQLTVFDRARIGEVRFDDFKLVEQ